MTRDIRTKLIELAIQKTTWSYSKLNEQLELGLNFKNDRDRALIGEWLGDISKHEYQMQRPLLSALVIHENDREQGDGFYKLCEELFDKPWQELKADSSYEIGKITECYEFWKNKENYKKYKDDY